MTNEFNLEKDLRNTDWIRAKIQSSDSYAQNLYAALCNNSFLPKNVFEVLKNNEWGCSWRYAGGMVADIRNGGHYLDYYCSSHRTDRHKGYVHEQTVTDEIREDLDQLGWIVVSDIIDTK
jgi:hypothetical protein